MMNCSHDSMDRVPWELEKITGSGLFTPVNKCPVLYGLNEYMHEIDAS